MASRSIHAELFSKIVAERSNADAIERGSPRNENSRAEKYRENKCTSFLRCPCHFHEQKRYF